MRLTKQDYFRILLPTKKEIWIVLALVAIIFATYEANLIFLRFTNDTMFADPALRESFNNQIDEFFASNFIANRITLIVFWAGIGLVSYSIIWSVYSFVSEGKAEVAVASEYVNQPSKHEKLQRSLTQAGILAGIVALGLLSISITMPYLIDLWTQGIMAMPEDIVYGVMQISLGFIGVCANLYLFKVLVDWIRALE